MKLEPLKNTPVGTLTAAEGSSTVVKVVEVDLGAELLAIQVEMPNAIVQTIVTIFFHFSLGFSAPAMCGLYI